MPVPRTGKTTLKVSGRRRWMSVDATAGYGALTWAEGPGTLSAFLTSSCRHATDIFVSSLTCDRAVSCSRSEGATVPVIGFVSHGESDRCC